MAAMAHPCRSVAAAVAALAVAALVAGCGGGGTDAWTREPTRECLVEEGLQPVPPRARADFVATTATNGALALDLRDNHVTILFGSDDAEAARLQLAYGRFGP